MGGAEAKDAAQLLAYRKALLTCEDDAVVRAPVCDPLLMDPMKVRNVKCIKHASEFGSLRQTALRPFFPQSQCQAR